MGERVRGISRVSYAWRIAATLLGIGLLLNGSLRMSDDAWPLGPLSQYAFSPAKERPHNFQFTMHSTWCRPR